MQLDGQSYSPVVWVSMPNCVPAWTEGALWAGNKSEVTTPQCCMKKWNSQILGFVGQNFCQQSFAMKNLHIKTPLFRLREVRMSEMSLTAFLYVKFKFNNNRNKRQRLHVLHRETSKWRQDACSPNFVTQAVFHQPRRGRQTSCPKSWLRVHRVVASAMEVPGSKQGGQICHLSPLPQGRERSSINGCQGMGMQSPLAEPWPVLFPFMSVATE